jgi:hypothetical protein
MVYGGVGFAILADRQWKSGPERVKTGGPRADHVVDPNFDCAALDVPGLVLLGEHIYGSKDPGILTCMTLADGAITAAKIATDAITSDELAATATAEIAAAAWAYATRTLTATAASTTSAVTGSALTITAGATYSATLSGMTIPADWLKLWLTIKADDAQTDAQSIVQVVESNPGVGTDGLLYLNGAAASSAALGALVVTQAAGTVAITLAAAATVLLERGVLAYDIKVLSGTDTVTLLTEGTATVNLTETKSIT